MMKKFSTLIAGLVLATSAWSTGAGGTLVDYVNVWNVAWSTASIDPTSPDYIYNVITVSSVANAPGGTTMKVAAGSSVDDLKMFMNEYLLAKAASLQMKIVYSGS